MNIPKTPRVLVCIPAYNEEKSITDTLHELKVDFPQADVVVINDNSSDHTASLARSCAVAILSLPFNLGYAGALQTGYKYAVQHGYDYVVQFDADGQHVAAEACKLYELTMRDEDVDIYIGSRFLEKTDYPHPFFRRLGTSLFSKIIRLSCGEDISDPTSGLQVLSRRCFSAYADMYGYPDYPDANLLIDRLHAGYVIREAPVQMRVRTDGQSMHSGIFKPIRYMVLVFYAIILILLRKRAKKS